MKPIAITGATGFLGRYLVRHFAGGESPIRAWYRAASDRSGIDLGVSGEWVPGDLTEPESVATLVDGCRAVVHAALFHPGGGFRGGEGELVPFVEANVIGTLRLVEAARAAGVERFVFVSTCAVHEQILDDRPLDESHPLWPRSHYGAHKAAIEKFVHSFGLGEGYPIASLRPTGIYGVASPPAASKWYDLVAAVVRGEPVTCRRGGKEVHAADVARGCDLLLKSPAEAIAGQAFNCYDRYISEWDVAHLAAQLSDGKGPIEGHQTSPRHQISTAKLKTLGMAFGGSTLFEQTIAELVQAAKAS